MQSKLLSTDDYLNGIRQGNAMILGKAITLIESKHPAHRKAAGELLAACQKYAGKSIRIGITGVPGVGKSTFIEALGIHLIREKNLKVGVLAIDPSSSRSGGSILGDKTRMNALSSEQGAFVRPSPSGGDLGGVRQTTTETITLLETAGYDVILIETVGVGQSETVVHTMVDFFLLLMLAGAGDQLQGIKRGIMEMADAVVINKADGDNEERAKAAAKEYRMALKLLGNSRDAWTSTVHHCSSLNNTGITEVWNSVSEFVEQAKASGEFEQNRQEQKALHFQEDWHNVLRQKFEDKPSFQSLYSKLKQEVLEGKLSSGEAAQKLFDELSLE